MSDIDKKWTIIIGGRDGFDGYCPSWYDNAYPFYGNKNQFSFLEYVDLTDHNILTQGPAVSTLTGGDENGSVTAAIIAISKTAVSNNVAFAIGGNLLHKISATAVIATGGFPHTITGQATETGCDVVHYQGKLLYSYNDSSLGGAGVTKGNIGSYDLATTFDDDYWTTALGGSNLENAVHYMIVGGDDVCYITNGRYIATLDGTTDVATGLDFWTDAEVVTLTWNSNRILAGVNRPNVSGSNFNQSGIYKWNGVSSSWEGDPIEVNGEIGALYTKNGITYCWWKDGTSTGGYNLGYIDGVRLITLKRYRGSLPNQSQVGEYKGFIAWATNFHVSGTEYGVMLWGSRDSESPVKMFPYCKGFNTNNIGAIAAPFGTLLIANTAVTTSINLDKVASTYQVACKAKSIAFNVNGVDYNSQIDKIRVLTNNLGTGAKCDLTLTYNQIVTTLALTQITSGYIHKILESGPQVEDFRIDVDWANGSATNPVQIKAIMIQGHYVDRN